MSDNQLHAHVVKIFKGDSVEKVENQISSYISSQTQLRVLSATSVIDRSGAWVTIYTTVTFHDTTKNS